MSGPFLILDILSLFLLMNSLSPGCCRFCSNHFIQDSVSSPSRHLLLMPCLTLNNLPHCICRCVLKLSQAPVQFYNFRENRTLAVNVFSPRFFSDTAQNKHTSSQCVSFYIHNFSFNDFNPLLLQNLPEGTLFVGSLKLTYISKVCHF